MSYPLEKDRCRTRILADVECGVLRRRDLLPDALRQEALRRGPEPRDVRPTPNRLPPLLLRKMCGFFFVRAKMLTKSGGGVQDSLAADDPQGVPAVPDGPEGLGRVEGVHRALPLAGPEQPTHRHAGALLHNRLG